MIPFIASRQATTAYTLVDGERGRPVEGHRAIDVVPHGRGIRPVAADRLQRPRRSERPFATDHGLGVPSLAFVPMAFGASPRIGIRSFGDGDLALWQPLAVWRDREVPSFDERRRRVDPNAVFRPLRGGETPRSVGEEACRECRAGLGFDRILSTHWSVPPIRRCSLAAP